MGKTKRDKQHEIGEIGSLLYVHKIQLIKELILLSADDTCRSRPTDVISRQTTKIILSEGIYSNALD